MEKNYTLSKENVDFLYTTYSTWKVYILLTQSVLFLNFFDFITIYNFIYENYPYSCHSNYTVSNIRDKVGLQSFCVHGMHKQNACFGDRLDPF